MLTKDTASSCSDMTRVIPDVEKSVSPQLPVVRDTDEDVPIPATVAVVMNTIRYKGEFRVS